MTTEQTPALPQLRFLDENGETYPDWATAKLGEVSTHLKRKNTSGNDVQNMTISAQRGIIAQGEYFTKDVASKTTTGYSLLLRGEFAYNKTNSVLTPYGATKRMTRYDEGAISPAYICFKVDESQVSAVYMEQLFESPIWQEALSTKTTTGVRKLLNINPSSYFSTALPLPSLPEQERIGAFLSMVDEWVETSAGLLENLVTRKQALLHQIITERSLRFQDENGEEYPEWEMVKLGEVAELKGGYAFKSSAYQSAGRYRVVTIKNVGLNRHVNMKMADCLTIPPIGIREHQMLNRGDVLVSMTGNVGRVAVVNDDDLLLNQRVGLLDPDESLVSKAYLLAILRGGEFEKAMTHQGQGGAQKNIGKDSIEGFDLPLPSHPEQERIGAFLALLDEEIETQRAHMDSLRLWKKGLLERMFV